MYVLRIGLSLGASFSSRGFIKVHTILVIQSLTHVALYAANILLWSGPGAMPVEEMGSCRNEEELDALRSTDAWWGVNETTVIGDEWSSRAKGIYHVGVVEVCPRCQATRVDYLWGVPFIVQLFQAVRCIWVMIVNELLIGSADHIPASNSEETFWSSHVSKSEKIPCSLHKFSIPCTNLRLFWKSPSIS
jgi:hypothetical protein